MERMVSQLPRTARVQPVLRCDSYPTKQMRRPHSHRRSGGAVPVHPFTRVGRNSALTRSRLVAFGSGVCLSPGSVPCRYEPLGVVEAVGLRGVPEAGFPTHFTRTPVVNDRDDSYHHARAEMCGRMPQTVDLLPP